MKQLILFIFIFSAISYFAFAQDDTLLPIIQKREDIKQYVEEKEQELHSQIQEKRQEIQVQIETQGGEEKTKLQILAQERILKIVTHIFEQLEAVLVKFDGIVMRIDARIIKLNEEGVSTTESEILLVHAKTKIEESSTLVAATKLELQKAITTEISKENIKKSIEICKISLKETQSSLIEVITSLKTEGNFEDDLLVE
jgi:hypothetical protein